MTHTAYVLPGDRSAGRRLEWETEEQLHALMLGEIGTEETRNSGALSTPFGPLVIWVKRLATLEELKYTPNLRAVFITELSGRRAQMTGTAVVTGTSGDGPNGPIPTDLSPVHFEHLQMIENGWQLAQEQHAKEQTLREQFKAALGVGDAERVEEIVGELAEINPELAGRLTLLMAVLGSRIR